MSVFGFAYYYHKNSSVNNIYWLCRISVFGLRSANKRPSGKKKDLIRVSFRKSITLSDDKPRIMLINAL